MVIAESSLISLNFAIKLSDGELVDSNIGQSPISMKIGDGNMLPGFEQCLFGLEEGSHEVFKISPESGFGARNQDNIQKFALDKFSHINDLSEGAVIDFGDAAETHRPGIVDAIEDGYVTIDFNHPLAGKDLLFEVQIHSVER